jgi:1,4-dihydroxy-2-naphthoate octaprenyltransferase
MRTLWQATRPYSFPAAAVPVAVGTALAPLLHPGLGVHWGHAALVLAGAIAAQAVSNLVNDLVDARRGIDHAGNAGRDNPIVAGTLGPGAMLGLAVAIGAAGLAIAAWLTHVAGLPVAGLAGAGTLLAVFYTAPPVALKYRALGDVAVFTAFGALILTGAYVVQAHAVPDPLGARALRALVAYGLPGALLVVAILYANNHRDRADDRAAGARTVANLLPAATSRRVLVALLVAPWAWLAAAALTGTTTRWVLLALLALPAGLPVARAIRADSYDGDLVPRIAGLHGLTGLLTVLGMAVAAGTR